MKNVAKSMFGLAFAALFFASCQQECDCTKQNLQGVETQPTRGAAVSYRKDIALSVKGELGQIQQIARKPFDKAALGGQEFSALQALAAKKEIQNDAKADAQFIASVFNNLMAAENKAALLDVSLTMSEQPVVEGMFLFSLESPEQQKVTFQLFKEDDFGMVANTQIDLNNGSNYRAFNVKEVPTGNYILKIRNEASQKEVVRRVSLVTPMAATNAQ